MVVVVVVGTRKRALPPFEAVEEAGAEVVEEEDKEEEGAVGKERELGAEEGAASAPSLEMYRGLELLAGLPTCQCFCRRRAVRRLLKECLSSTLMRSFCAGSKWAHHKLLSFLLPCVWVGVGW